MVKNADITLYHGEYDPVSRRDRWTSAQYPGVSWYGGQKVVVKDKGFTTSDGYTVRIFTGGLVSAKAGDVVVYGLVNDEITNVSQLKGYPHFTVTAVQDNRRGSPGLHHWRLEGK